MCTKSRLELCRPVLCRRGTCGAPRAHLQVIRGAHRRRHQRHRVSIPLGGVPRLLLEADMRNFNSHGNHLKILEERRLHLLADVHLCDRVANHVLIDPYLAIHFNADVPTG